MERKLQSMIFMLICRHTVIVSAALGLALAGCGLTDVGDVTGGPGPGDVGAGGPDAGSSSDPGAPDAAAVACDDPVSTQNTGEHNAGKACIACHINEGGAPNFTLAGTLYNTIGGAAPVAGATIHVVDANGTDIPLITAVNGNFYTTQAIAFPVKMSASSCPDTLAMVGPVNEAGGDCNQGGCHDAANRIHLP